MLPAWEADEDAPHCHNCKVVFTLWNRRHHCRQCGIIFCGVCCPHRLPEDVEWLKKSTRICDSCTDGFWKSRMRAIALFGPTQSQDMAVTWWPFPVLKPDQVLIKVVNFGLNFVDTIARAGSYMNAPPYPFVPGFEVAGVVVKVAPEVTAFQKGDSVLAFTNFGGYAEYAAADCKGVAKFPEGMTFAEAASIPVQYVTAYHSLRETGSLREGSRVLIHSAAGGVGLAAVQIAKALRCTVIATASTAAKLQLLKEEYKVDHAFNYTSEDYCAEVLKVTNGEGVDVVLDSLGGSHLKKGMDLLRPHGRVVGLGATSLASTNALTLLPAVVSMFTLNAIDCLINSKSFCGVNLHAVATHRPDVIQASLHSVLTMWKEGLLKCTVTQCLPWEQIEDAHNQIESRQTTGKIILSVTGMTSTPTSSNVGDFRLPEALADLSDTCYDSEVPPEHPRALKEEGDAMEREATAKAEAFNPPKASEDEHP